MAETNGYMTIKQAATQWGIAPKIVETYCRKGYIPDVVKEGDTFLIPEAAEKPRKYQFILTLPYEDEIYSAEDIEGHLSWPNHSQSDPVSSPGIFDTYEEALEAGRAFKVYQYVNVSCQWYSYDDTEEGGYYLSYYDAQDAAINANTSRDGSIHPTEYRIEEVEVEEDEDTGSSWFDDETPEEDIEVIERNESNGSRKVKAYKYLFFLADTCVYDSMDNEEYYYSYEHAENAAMREMDRFDCEYVPDGAYEIEQIEGVDVRVEEI